MFERQLFTHKDALAVRRRDRDAPRVPLDSLDTTRIRTMAHADYQTALKNGIDAARSGSRMMARLHLLKAADLAPDDVAAHLWLAWVAETPADALVHLDEAFARQPQHALTRLGRLWTRLMAEFDPVGDNSRVDLSELSGGAENVRLSASRAGADVARTQRLGGQTLVELREKSAHRDAAQGGSPATASQPPSGPTSADTPLDLRQTVRMDLVRRERPEEVDEPSPALTCLMPQKPQSHEPPAAATQPSASSNEAASSQAAANEAATIEPKSTNVESAEGEEALSTGTIRIGPNAVKRALAESVIVEMMSPDHNAHAAADVVAAEAATPDSPTANPAPPGHVTAAAANQDPAREAPRVDEYTEPPRAALSPEAPERGAASRSGPNLTGPRVLVVDDSPTVRKLVAATLEAQGYRVACVASGYEAVEVLANATPDALVIEVDLPRLDGLHLCKLIRSHEATRQIPVVFLTRRSGTMDRVRGKMVGATAYLTKPFRSVALIEELAACCPVRPA